MGRQITVGTRRSDLAMWQTWYVIDLLTKAHPGLTAEIQVISTKGDEIIDKPLPEIGGKGLFTQALESALRRGEIDLAVHSLKDLPTQNPPEIVIGAIPERADARDVLVSRNGETLEQLPKGATVGTSSRRRAAQLLAYRGDLTIIDIRGNVPTRIKKSKDVDGPYDATVLAKAGVDRLELGHEVSQILPMDVMLPAPGQGAMGVQCRDDALSHDLLAPIVDTVTLRCVTAERAFLRRLEAGCSAPVAAYATVDDRGDVDMVGRVALPDGQFVIERRGRNEDATTLGYEMAQEALEAGANDILRTVR